MTYCTESMVFISALFFTLHFIFLKSEGVCSQGKAERLLNYSDIIQSPNSDSVNAQRSRSYIIGQHDEAVVSQSAESWTIVQTWQHLDGTYPGRQQRYCGSRLLGDLWPCPVCLEHKRTIQIPSTFATHPKSSSHLAQMTGNPVKALVYENTVGLMHICNRREERGIVIEVKVDSRSRK